MTTIIYGRQPVLAALRRGNAPLEEILVAEGLGGRFLSEVRDLARAQGLDQVQVAHCRLRPTTRLSRQNRYVRNTPLRPGACRHSRQSCHYELELLDRARSQ